MDENKEYLEQRCPRLGGQVSFGYCRMGTDDGSACWKIFDCWWEYFDVVEYLKKKNYFKTEAEFFDHKLKIGLEWYYKNCGHSGGSYDMGWGC